MVLHPITKKRPEVTGVREASPLAPRRQRRKQIFPREPNEDLCDGRARSFEDTSPLFKAPLDLDGGELRTHTISERARVITSPTRDRVCIEGIWDAGRVGGDVDRSGVELIRGKQAPARLADGSPGGLIRANPCRRVEQSGLVFASICSRGAGDDLGLQEVILHLVPAPRPTQREAVALAVRLGTSTIVRGIVVKISIAEVADHLSGPPSLLFDLRLESVFRPTPLHEWSATEDGAEDGRFELALDKDLVHRHGLPPFKRTISSSGIASAR